jgi:hypothetical protein
MARHAGQAHAYAQSSYPALACWALGSTDCMLLPARKQGIEQQQFPAPIAMFGDRPQGR